MELPKEYGPSRDTQTLSYAETDDISRLSKAFMETWIVNSCFIFVDQVTKLLRNCALLPLITTF